MTDIQVDERTATPNGPNPVGSTNNAQAPVPQAAQGTGQVATSTPGIGRNRSTDIVWLLVGIIDAVLALDFIFHAAGANSVGFSAFIFSIGTFFAAPFAGIFNTTYATAGNLVIWADVLGIVVYSLIALGLAKVVTVMTKRSNM